MIHFLGLKGMPRWSAGPSSCGHCQESKGCHTGSIGGDDAVWPGDLHVNDAFGTYNFFFSLGGTSALPKRNQKTVCHLFPSESQSTYPPWGVGSVGGG